MAEASRPDEMKALALAYLEAAPKRDLAGMRALFTDDIVMWWPPSAAKQFGGGRCIRGADEFVAFAGEPIDRIYRRETMRWEIHRMVVDGDFVWMRATLTALTPRDVPYQNMYFVMLRIEGDKIAEIWESIDTAYAYAVFNAAGPEEVGS
jgi:ketosteroid isomerase-like protein